MQLLKNNVSGLLSLQVNVTDTSMTLQNAASFPDPGADDYLVTLIGLNGNAQESSWEIVKVTAKSTHTLTIVRAQEGTTAQNWPALTAVQMRLTAGSVPTKGAFDTHVANTANPHATTKAQVGLANVENTALSTWAGSSNLTTLGTVGTGVWNGTVIGSAYGGTGVNNASRTLTVNTNSGTLAFSSASSTLTIAATASVSGTNTGDQTIALTGDVTGSGTGSFAATLANSGVTAGTYNNAATTVRPFTVDAKGRVTAIGAAVTIAPPFSAVTDKPTTLAGYGITNAQALDADLTAIAALAGTSGLLKKTAADTWTLDTSTYLTANQSISVTGDATGSGATAIALTLANSGATAGTYKSVTVDAKGRVTAGTNPTTLASYGITDAQALDADLTAIAGLTGTSGVLKKTDADTWTLDTAAYLTANQSISLSGDATGSGATAIAVTLASSGVDAGTYKSVTVDAKGRVTAGTNPTTLAGYGISDALSSSTSSTQSGYFGDLYLYDDSTPSHYLQITNSANLTDARVLSLDVNDANRTVSLSGNLTVSSAATISGTNTGDQTIALTGDVTGTGTGSFAATLAASGVTAGTYNDAATAVRPFTVDAKGRITAIGNAVTLAPAFSAITDKPTTLAGYGITDAQALDADLTAIAALTGTNGWLKKTAADTWALDASAYLTANQTITFTGAATGEGTTAVALTLADSGATAGTYKSVTVNAKGLVTAGTNPTTLAGYGITDAYTKTEVDTLVTGLDTKQSVRAATTANITLAAAQTIDGVSVVAGDRVLVKNQSTAATNGIYVVATGTWTRATDADANAEVTAGLYVFVEEGTTNADSGWVLTTDGAITVGSTALSFAQFNGLGQVTAGAGLTKTGNTLDVATASSARIVVNAESIDLATAGSAGTYRSVTTDAYGRVTAGTNPTTLAGYGITDAQALDADLTAIAALAGTSGFLKKTAADTWALDSSTYLTANQSISVTGDATGSGATAIALTLANSGATAGTYTKVTVDAKGRVTTGAALASSDVTTALGFTPANKAGDTFTGQVKVDSAGASTVFNINGGTSSGFITHLIANTTAYANDNGATSGALFGALAQPTISNSGAGGGNGNAVWGGYFAPQIASSGATAPVVAYGVQGFAERSNVADVSASASNVLHGGFFTARHTTNIANATSSASLTAVTGSTVIQGGTATNAYGLFTTGSVGSSATVNNTVSVTNYYQFFGNAVAVGSAANSFGTITNYYGLYLSAPTLATRGTITNRWGLYQVDTAANNFVGGKLGLNVTPTAQLDVSGNQAANIVAVAALEIVCSSGNYFTKTINANSIFTVSGVPASRAYAFTLELTHTSGTVTWFAGVQWPGGTAPTLTTGKVHLFTFVTDDGGSNWRGASQVNYNS